ncbi:MAG: glutamate-1-semialdehyde 2,1-aminomutase [Nitrososphaerota archaeon]|nr:glutamate-1-semialdehyde 2,1-aminomutase [Nitrososphaerota archaeon]
MKSAKSAELYDRASKVMVGGVSSPVRAFKAVGGTPRFISRGKKAHIWDEDGNRYIDYVCSWGALILGHADRRVLAYVSEKMRNGTSFGAPTREEVLLAEKIRGAFPSVDKVRFVNSGTEATMSAVRAARGYARRAKVVKFEGCYHGHADQFLTKAGSGMATFDLPASAGVTEGSVADTVTLPFNDLGAAEAEFRKEGDKIAAVIVEPVAGNMGVVPPAKGFLSLLRRECTKSGAVLIFDEVITGFRVGPGGAQKLYGVEPDLTTLGKIIGGGFPVGAYGGKREIMEMVSPEGPVYQAGTLSGNPVAMAAGLKTLELLTGGSYDRLERSSKTLEEGLESGASRAGTDIHLNRVGSMIGLFFATEPVRNYAEAKKADAGAYRRFFWSMLGSGVYLAPSAFEATFVSLAHDTGDIEATVESAARSFKELDRS